MVMMTLGFKLRYIWWCRIIEIQERPLLSCESSSQWFFFYLGYVVYQFKAKASLWGLRIQDMHKVLMLTSKRKKNQKKIWDNLDALFLEAVSH